MTVDDAANREERILKTRVLFQMLRHTLRLDDADLILICNAAFAVFERMSIEEAMDFTAENFSEMYQTSEGWRDDLAKIQGYTGVDDPRRKADTARFFNELGRESSEEG